MPVGYNSSGINPFCRFLRVVVSCVFQVFVVVVVVVVVVVGGAVVVVAAAAVVVVQLNS